MSTAVAFWAHNPYIITTWLGFAVYGGCCLECIMPRSKDFYDFYSFPIYDI
jgi:hypothetical protein